ncbi:MAG TPA: DNA-binding response regulator [Desulfovibrio sp.]|nr:DNA-binding response regulator [Desulfovibrio sp.]
MPSTIVIVEDEHLERQALKRILTNELGEPCELLEASTGQEAIDIIDNHSFDLMLLDISIPRPNGLEVLRHLREKNSEVKVVITTAHDDFNMAREAITLKADEYLLKPIRVEELVKTVRSCLETEGDTGQRNRELVQSIFQFCAQGMLQDAVVILREHLNWIYAQHDDNTRRRLFETAEAIEQCAMEKGLASEDLQKEVERLKKINTGAQSSSNVFESFFCMLDHIFNVSYKHLGIVPDTMQNVLGYIERNISRGVTLEETAEHCHISSSYLSRLFKKSAGVNFVSYVTKRRMDLAKELLEKSDFSVTAIALELSYNDVQYFYKTFKKAFGVSPTEYRTQYTTLS